MTCEELKSTLVGWMSGELDCEGRGDNRFVLTLPLLKPNGDSIDLGVERLPDRWRISDLGQTHATLFLNGVDLVGNRGVEFRDIQRSFGIVERGRELLLESAIPEVAAAVFEFVHAIQSMLALQLTVTPLVQRRDFEEIVKGFFVKQRTIFEVPAEGVEGKTGRWPFALILNHVPTRQPVLVKTLSANDRKTALKTAKETVFEVSDIRQLRETSATVIADDEGRREKLWDADMLRVFDGYDIPVYAYQRDRSALLGLAERHRG